MKQEFKPGARIYDTSWLFGNISISNGDLTAAFNGNANRAELKFRTPILNYAQRLEFGAGLYHVVVHPTQRNINGKLNFESEHYDIYCPFREYDFERIQRGWLLNARPCSVPREQARRILSAYEVWPCCRRFTIYQGVATSRESVEDLEDE